MALVFTALADSGCALLLWAGNQSKQLEIPLWKLVDPKQCIALAMISIGLYGFGMSLNDIIDRRRDRQISPMRPIPSGRIGIVAAHVICVMLILMALVGGEAYSSARSASHISLLLVFFTAGLITFYDFAAKYLVTPGLLSLGLIRFFHATIAAPSLPVLWHPLLLLNHVTIISALSYHWEQKRPALRPVHWWSISTGLLGINILAIAMVIWRLNRHGIAITPASLSIQPSLLGPLGAAAVFAGLAIWIRRQNPNPRDAGQALMLAGLLWLIVYDAGFVTAYVGLKAGLLLVLLLPVAYMSVLVMRSWSKLILLSQRPDFKRVET
jgi:4-hydroxybenzoate polyprenyltransferase